MRHLVLVLLLALSAPPAVPAQEPTTAGFFFAYEPGDRESFEAGYRRHLDWHRSQEDSLSWFGWDVIVGPRPGLFVDGVFGVPFRVLDARVDPAGDQADAAENVLPHADPVSREMVALRPELSSATPLREGAPTPFVQVVRYAVDPAGIETVEAALAALREEASGGALLPYTIYERVAGARPGFVLMIWRDRLATFDEHARNPDRAFHRIVGERIRVDGSESPLEAASSEIWLYRRDLTYLGQQREER